MQKKKLASFISKNFYSFIWKEKVDFLCDIVEKLKEIHDEKFIHRNLHSGSILIRDNKNNDDEYLTISGLGFNQPASINSNLTRDFPNVWNNTLYGTKVSNIHMRRYLQFRDDYVVINIKTQDQEHETKLILDILDKKRPEIIEDTPECWTDLMKRCWHSDPPQRNL